MQRLFISARRPFIVFCFDAAMVIVAWWLAFTVRFQFDGIPNPFRDSMQGVLPLLIGLQASCFFYFGLYRGIWHYASLQDVKRIAKAALAGTAFIVLASYFTQRLSGIPRSVIALYPVFLIFLLGGPRLSYRLWKERGSRRGQNKQRLVIVGLTPQTEAFARTVASDPNYHILGFVGQDKTRLGRELHGARVLCELADFPQRLESYSCDLVVVGLDWNDAHNLQSLVLACKKQGVLLRSLPRIEDVLSGKLQLQLQDVSVEHLLQRSAHTEAWGSMQHFIAGAVVVVTGAGGSIGQALCYALARLQPKHIIAIDRNEYHLFRLEQRLHSDYPKLSFSTHLLDICHKKPLEQLFLEKKPQLVLHAAAFKHVPLLENHVEQAIENNILGTETVLQAAILAEVEAFVFVSTDKAVHPENVMGASKRAAELLLQSMSPFSGTKLLTVRFGNVLESMGSVVPTFRAQIEKGGPVTVTHPEMTRYFMTIDEAAWLILQAAAMGQGGEIFVLDMGQPVSVLQLAEQMISLSGKEPYTDIDIIFTGLRPGEKLHEALHYAHETLSPTAHPKIRLYRAQMIENDQWRERLQALMRSLHSQHPDNIKRNLFELVTTQANQSVA